MYKLMNQTLVVILERLQPAFVTGLIFLTVSLAGCAMWRAITPGGVTPADAEWEGVKSAQMISPDIMIDPVVGAAFSVFLGVDTGKILGILPVTPIGETLPKYVLCTDKYVEKCKDIPVFAKVHVAGEAIGPNLWKPSRLTADDFND